MYFPTMINICCNWSIRFELALLLNLSYVCFVPSSTQPLGLPTWSWTGFDRLGDLDWRVCDETSSNRCKQIRRNGESLKTEQHMKSTVNKSHEKIFVGSNRSFFKGVSRNVQNIAVCLLPGRLFCLDQLCRTPLESRGVLLNWSKQNNNRHGSKQTAMFWTFLEVPVKNDLFEILAIFGVVYQLNLSCV